ncbi:uncharacterized protein LOC123660449 isoform X1 [Melitaea cinxia]|uniref:uncharacterized protein LOC123660449 isoform X1 n=1 Tax=Melitaea cinxia TaxID=113334 RepID=UPI001E272EC2|nr:uncharacterized protein LOC123660449 isoform X1 [Melitaea cinxia]
MKVLTTVFLLFAVLMTFAVEADAGSFNLSLSLDPGFTIGRGRTNRRHRMNVRHEEASDDGEVATESSNPEEVHNFEVPEAFTNEAGEVEGNDDRPSRHQKSHRRSQKH